MPKLRIPGTPDAVPVRPVLADTVDGITERESVNVGSGRSGAALVDIDGSFIELELGSGVRLWGRTEDVAARWHRGAGRGGDGIPELPVVLPIGRASRDVGSGLTVVAARTFELTASALLTDWIVEKVETGKAEGGELRQCATPDLFALSAPAPMQGTAPVLVFIHGTASSTEGSFGGLWQAGAIGGVLGLRNVGAQIRSLFRHYGGRVLAFEHRSLTDSPVANALALVEQLSSVVPTGTELHLVSHSRGGLIGELLCRGMREDGVSFDAHDLRLFADDGRKKDLMALQALGNALQEQRYRIGRFVRVACPAAGTTLASRRLDLYFSMLVNVAGTVAGIAADPLYRATTNALAAVLAKKAEPDDLPGLEAMMPTSPLVALLNRNNVVTSADLHVLGGDLAPRSVVSAIMALATDLFYFEDHDLVVNTRSMLRGARRAAPVKYFVDTGGEVTHFHYFRNPETANRLTDILTTGSADLRVLRVPPDQVGRRSYRKRDAASLPLLFLVPGFMGTHLDVGGIRVWASGAALASGRLSGLAVDAKPKPKSKSKPEPEPGDSAEAVVEPTDLVAVYEELVTALAPLHELVPFGYDWRSSFADNAEQLAQAIRLRIGESQPGHVPVRILTHGAGGLVLQTMLATPSGRELWEQLRANPGSRAVMLGPPFEGSMQAVLACAGRGALAEGLSAIDVVHRGAFVRTLLASFDGLLDLLPAGHAAGASDWFVAEPWAAAGFEAPAEAKRRSAAIRRQERSKANWEAGGVSVVLGTGTPTLTGVTPGDGGAFTIDGDGYTTWRGVPEAIRSRTYLAATDHGGLVTASDLRSATLELLTTGGTQRLSGLPPIDGAVATSQPGPLPELSIVPDVGELIASGLGIDPRPTAPERPRIAVRVVHDSLSRAASPVLVGHYAQDGFANAEAYLDRQMAGRLRERHAMRLYPEAIGTSAIEIQPSDAPFAVHPGAIVVGLGGVGALTPGSLLKTLEQGLTMYGAERLAERARRQQDDDAKADEEHAAAGGPFVSLSVTSLLVGSGEAGLTLRDSIHTLLQAVLGANARLAAPAVAAEAARRLPVPQSARIAHLDIVELYEDKAVEALRTVRELAELVDFVDEFSVVPTLSQGEEGRQRVSYDEQAAWWQRLRVIEQDASVDPRFETGRRVLKFEAFTERARIDAYAVSSQREIADSLIADAMASTAAIDGIGHALFERLVPNDIKERAPDQRDTVLLLDARTATIPWELFEDTMQADRRQPRKPLAIEAGMVRQLIGVDARSLVRRATGKGALVIGCPRLTDPRFPWLPAADAEARAVAARFGGDYEVKLLVPSDEDPTNSGSPPAATGVSGKGIPRGPLSDPPVRAMLTALDQKPWRIIHLALHGVFDFELKPGSARRSGVVIGDGVVLEAADISQLRYTPDLVFLNCCHVGNTAGDTRPQYTKLAANLATQFIEMGVRAVVAAGWAVDDLAARAFADRFYLEMLKGRTFGEATLTARRDIHARFPHVNTWGAYQCYGDPAFSLQDISPRTADRPMVCLRELIVEADAIRSRARAAEDLEVEDLRTRLDKMVAAAEPGWLQDARVSSALGAAYGELREFGRAIDLYARARGAEKAEATGVALEQLANLKGRYAEHVWRDARTPSDARDQVELLLKEADELLDRLVTLNPSAERHALRGGLEKRRAMVRVATDSQQARAALRMMEAHYKEAYRIKEAAKHRNAFYPYINMAVARLASSWLDPSDPARDAEGLAENIERLAEFEETIGADNDFWSLGFIAEAELLRSLYARDATRVIGEATVRGYRHAQRRGRSRREIDSVLTQVRFLSLIAASSNEETKRLGKALDQLARQLAEPQ